MHWLRSLSLALGGMAGGGLIGAWLGHGVESGWACALLGSLAGLSAAAVPQWRQASALRAWINDPATNPAPTGGYWGDLAYRIERTMLRRDRAIQSERARHEQLLRAMEASPNGLILLDAEDHIVWCNAVAADHHGLDPVRDLRQRVTNLVRHPAFVQHLQEGRYESAALLSTQGGRRMLSVLVRPFGEGMKLVLSQDTTERERADAMRRDFVANVSHEVRTPLTVLSGFVETMATVPLSEAERRHVLELMGRQTSRMQRLVADLLALAQLEGSPRPPADHWCRLDALVRQVESEASALSQGRHPISVSGDTHWELAGQEAELHSALGNLMSNAVRYTPEGGQVRLSVEARPDGGLALAVEDTGPGIAREHLSRLTERFYRVDSSRSRDTGGTGLGLSIVKHVMQRHGGSLDVASEPGKGSRFTLVFPAARLRRPA